MSLGSNARCRTTNISHTIGCRDFARGEKTKGIIRHRTAKNIRRSARTEIEQALSELGVGERWSEMSSHERAIEDAYESMLTDMFDDYDDYLDGRFDSFDGYDPDFGYQLGHGYDRAAVLAQEKFGPSCCDSDDCGDWGMFGLADRDEVC